MPGTPQIKLKAKVVGADRILRCLRQFKQSKVNRISRNAVGVAGRYVAKVAKANAPSETGALKKSIAAKIGTFRNGRGAYAVIGARRGIKRIMLAGGGVGHRFTRFGRSLKVKHKGREPANYIHLVEYGHRIVLGGTATRLRGRYRRAAASRQTGERGRGRISGKVKGSHFMSKTWSSTGGAAKAMIKEEMARGVLRELAKR